MPISNYKNFMLLIVMDSSHFDRFHATWIYSYFHCIKQDVMDLDKLNRLQDMILTRMITDDKKRKSAFRCLAFFRSPESNESDVIAFCKFRYPLDYAISVLLSILNLIDNDNAEPPRDLKESEIDEFDAIIEEVFKDPVGPTVDQADRLGTFLVNLLHDKGEDVNMEHNVSNNVEMN